MEILFVCNGNINRSVIAEAIFNRLSKKNHAASAGRGLSPNAPAGTLVKDAPNNPVAVMKEYGYDISRKRIRKITGNIIDSADIVILVLSKKKYKGHLSKRLEGIPNLRWWDVVSIPEDAPSDKYYKLEKRRIEKIESLVRALIKEMG